jgi:hypothetical protein
VVDRAKESGVGLKTFVSYSLLIVAHVVMITSLASMSVLPASTSISELFPECIALEWNTLLEGSVDPRAIDLLLATAAYIRVWQMDNKLLWAMVCQFANSTDAKDDYDLAKAELSDASQLETIGEECSSLTSPSGLKLFIFYRQQYLVITGSAIMNDPNTSPPDPALVQKLAEEIDKRVKSLSDSVTDSITTTSSFGSQPVPVHFAGYLSHQAEQKAPSISTDVKVELRKEGKLNGTITLRIKIFFLGKKNDKCKYRIGLYITKVEGIEDDGDGFARGAGDLFVAGEFDTICGTFPFFTGEIGDFAAGQKEPLDLTDGGKKDGYLACFKKWCFQECEIDCRKKEFEFSLRILVRDNDTDDILDILSSVLKIAARLLKKPIHREAAKKAAEGIDKLKGKALEEIKKEVAEDPISAARKVRGDDIGEGKEKGLVPLPMPMDACVHLEQGIKVYRDIGEKFGLDEALELALLFEYMLRERICKDPDQFIEGKREKIIYFEYHIGQALYGLVPEPLRSDYMKKVIELWDLLERGAPFEKVLEVQKSIIELASKFVQK